MRGLESCIWLIEDVGSAFFDGTDDDEADLAYFQA